MNADYCTPLPNVALMSLDERVKELTDTVRSVLELRDDAPVTTLRLRQALSKTRSAFEYTNKAGRILDQWRALFSEYTKLACEEGLEPVEKRFPDLHLDYTTAVDAAKRARPLAEAFYVFKRLLNDEDSRELADALSAAAEKIRIVEVKDEEEPTGSSQRSSGTPPPSAQGP